MNPKISGPEPVFDPALQLIHGASGPGEETPPELTVDPKPFVEKPVPFQANRETPMKTEFLGSVLQ